MAYFQLIIYIFIIFAASQAAGQNRIFLKDNSIIKIDSIFSIQPHYVEYVADGSVHDKAIEKIARIENKGQLIVFDQENKPLIRPLTAKDNNNLPVPTPKEPQQNKSKTGNKFAGPDPFFNQHAMAWSINVFPLTILEEDGGPRAGLEIPLKPNLSIHQDITIISPIVFNLLNNDKREGFAYRGELKYYFAPHGKFQERFFVAPQLQVHQKTREEIVFYSIQTSFPAEEFNRKLTENAFAGNIKAGLSSAVSKRLISEMYFGFGFKYTETRDKKVAVVNARVQENISESSVKPNVLLGIMFGLRLNK